MEFTVLLSIYHKESPLFFEQSLNSIFNQTLQPSEVIIVKDGPLTKELDTIINFFCNKHKQIKVIPLPKNVGLGNALNEGIKYCSHELIARMDTDDIAKKSRFEKQIAVFKNDASIDVCSGWIEEFEGNCSNVLSIKKIPEEHNEIFKYSKHRCPINHPAVMYKKSAVIKAGGYEGFPEDYRLWVKMLMNGNKFYNIQESILFFRFSKEMIKRRGGWKYAMFDIKSQFDFYKMGFINIPTFLYNIFIRVLVRLVPTSGRNFIYKHLLRK